MNAKGAAESRTYFLALPDSSHCAVPRHFGPISAHLHPFLADKPSASLAILAAIAGITRAAPATACAFHRPKRLAVASATLFCEAANQSRPIPPPVLTRISTRYRPLPDRDVCTISPFPRAAVRLFSLSFFTISSAFAAAL